MKTDYIDNYLTHCWNVEHTSERLLPEHFWDTCRLLEEYKILQADPSAVSTFSIGPFKIASNINVSQKEMIIYLFETIIPTIFATTVGLPFAQVYTLYLVPVVKLFANVLDSSCRVKDILQWEILLYIKKQNLNNTYPTRNEIKKNMRSDFDSRQVNDAIKKMMNIKNLIGVTSKIIECDHEGRFSCLV